MRWRGPEGGERTRLLGAGQVYGRHSVQLSVELLEAPFELVDDTTGERIACQVVIPHDPLAARPYAEQRWSLAQTDSHSIGALHFVPVPK